MVVEEIKGITKKYIINMLRIIAVICLLTVLPIENIASGSSLVWESALNGDKSITFFAEAGTGKLLFYEVSNLPGAGGGVTIPVVRNNTSDQLAVTFNGESVEVRFLSDGASVAIGKQSDINCCQPLALSIAGGKLTIQIGDESYNADQVSAFSGSLTTQRLTGELKAYR